MLHTSVIPNLWEKSTTLELGSFYVHSRELFPSEYQKTTIEQFIWFVYGQERSKGIAHIDFDGQPYENADIMRVDYHTKKRLLISTEYNNPAVIEPDTNLAFRFAHDSHHCQSDDCNFGLWGELCAYSKFANYTSSLWLRQWLFTEIVLQNCALILLGDYAPQKYIFAPRWAVDTVDKAYGLKAAYKP